MKEAQKKEMRLLMCIIVAIVLLGGLVSLLEQSTAKGDGSQDVTAGADLDMLTLLKVHSDIMEGCLSEAHRFKNRYTLTAEDQVAIALALYQSLQWR